MEDRSRADNVTVRAAAADDRNIGTDEAVAKERIVKPAGAGNASRSGKIHAGAASSQPNRSGESTSLNRFRRKEVGDPQARPVIAPVAQFDQARDLPGPQCPPRQTLERGLDAPTRRWQHSLVNPIELQIERGRGGR
jgi:hypothetical protein